MRTKGQIEEDIKSKSKVCSKCKKRLPFVDFHALKDTVDGRHQHCRDCVRLSRPASSRKSVRSKEEIRLDLESGTKVCTICKIRLPFTSFHTDNSSPDKCRPICKSCVPKLSTTYHRKSSLKVKYGISDNTYNKMLVSQGGVCKICGMKDTKRLSVDHCHSTGKVRGLLCTKCNTGIGLLQDNSKLLSIAAEYLRGYE